jgi:hypothetical protein
LSYWQKDPNFKVNLIYLYPKKFRSPSVAERRFSITEKFFGSSMPGSGRRNSASEIEKKSETGFVKVIPIVHYSYLK